MDYIFLEENPFELNYRYLTWEAFKYFCTHSEILNIEKYKIVYDEIFDFFIKRRKTQLNIDECSGEEIKIRAITEYYSFFHSKKLTLEDIEEYVENFDKNKHLLVIRIKK